MTVAFSQPYSAESPASAVFAPLIAAPDDTAPDDTEMVSYAGSACTPQAEKFIRRVEDLTGRRGLLRRVQGYRAEMARGRDFWEIMLGRYGIGLEVLSGHLDAIPASGPVVVVANHPFGILDGMVMGRLLSRRRQDFNILAHAVFRRADVLRDVVLPIDFADSRMAVRTNVATRAAALKRLQGGGAIGIFPAGTVATARHPLGRPMDAVWRGFVARLVARSGATVVPVYFDGANSRLFQIASHLNTTLRMALLIAEFRARLDRPVSLAVGAPIPPERLAPLRDDPKALLDFLRRATYQLAPGRVDPLRIGYEFEARYRR